MFKINESACSCQACLLPLEQVLGPRFSAFCDIVESPRQPFRAAPPSRPASRPHSPAPSVWGLRPCVGPDGSGGRGLRACVCCPLSCSVPSRSTSGHFSALFIPQQNVYKLSCVTVNRPPGIRRQEYHRASVFTRWGLNS